MRTAVRKPPSYRLHKPKGQAVVTLNGKDFYLGKFGTPESKQAYGRKIAEWNANGGHIMPKATERGVFVAEVLAAFIQHAEQHYRNSDGTPSTELGVFKPLIGLVNELYGDTAAANFGPLALKTVRQGMIERGWTRRSINKQVNRIKHIFKWATAQEMIPVSVYHGLVTVSGLRRGHDGVLESDPKTPVPDDHIEAVRPYVSRQVWALIQLQLATAARAGELVRMRPADLDMSSDTTEDDAKSTPDSTPTSRYRRWKRSIG
jgi:hypothetical protein